jgi:PPE-repeat protein
MTNPQTEPWGGYIPEINAGRYETGTGPETWLSAAVSWDMYASMVAEATLLLFAQMAAVSMNWTGVATTARDAAMQPFVGWLADMEAMALANSMSSYGVATAFAAGNGTMIPLPAVNANRISEAIAEATNFMGVNEPIIAYLNAQYAEFWGENASTMSVYDAAIQAATTLRPVSSPPPLASLAAAGADDAANMAQSAANAGAQSGIQGATEAVSQSAGDAAGSGDAMSAMQSVMGPAQSLMSAPQSLMQVPQQVMQQGQSLMSPLQSMLGNLGGGSSAGPESALYGGLGMPLSGMSGGAGSFGGGGSGLVSSLGGGLGGPKVAYGGGAQLTASDKALFSGINQKAAAMSAALGPSGASGGGGMGAPMAAGAGTGAGGTSRSPREILKAAVATADEDDAFSPEADELFEDD